MNQHAVFEPELMEWLLLEDGNVITLDDAQPKGRSVLIGNGRILAVFDTPRPEIRLSAARMKRFNLGGKTVLPAFTDSHIHFLQLGISLGRANLEPARSPADTTRLLAEFHEDHPVAPGSWVIGQGWSHNQWHDPTLPLDTSLIDAVFPKNPVILHSLCGHLAWLNAEALRVAGLTRDTPDPPGGELARHPETKDLTGILKENAIELAARQIPRPTLSERREALRRAIREAHSHGIVAIHNVESVETFRLFQEARREGWLDMHVAYYLPVDVLDEVVKAGIRSNLGDDRLRVCGVKLFTDGSLGGRTAWMLEPYLEEPKHSGIPTLEVETLRAIVRKANGNGLSCAIHAIGDRAVRETLRACHAAWEALDDQPALRRTLRNRIEHFQTVHPDDFAYLKDMPMAACMQPVHLFADWRAADRFFGPERARWTYPCRSLAAAGACVALGSDAPVATINIAIGLYAAAYRRDLEGNPEGGWIPEECLSMDAALRGYCTAGPAITGDEEDRGRIRPGHRADLAILDTDPFTASPEELRSAAVTDTLFDGRWVHGEFAG